jgi:type II secretory pathway pseudopilin PulG
MITKFYQKDERGLTMVETLIAMVILFGALAGAVPLMMAYSLQNIRNEIKSGALAASSQVMDQLRQCDVTTLPRSGTTTIPATTTSTTSPCGTTIQPLQYTGKLYGATITYCQNTSYCDTNTRQVQIQISYNNANVYQAETVYTNFQ